MCWRVTRIVPTKFLYFLVLFLFVIKFEYWVLSGLHYTCTYYVCIYECMLCISIVIKSDRNREKKIQGCHNATCTLYIVPIWKDTTRTRTRTRVMQKGSDCYKKEEERLSPLIPSHCLFLSCSFIVIFNDRHEAGVIQPISDSRQSGQRQHDEYRNTSTSKYTSTHTVLQCIHISKTRPLLFPFFSASPFLSFYLHVLYIAQDYTLPAILFCIRFSYTCTYTSHAQCKQFSLYAIHYTLYTGQT